MARAITLSGRRVTYITPIALRREVQLHSACLTFGPLIGVAAVSGLILNAVWSSVTLAWLTAVLVASALLVPGSHAFRRLIETDLERAGPRRRNRYPDNPSAW
jgi:hypothetical protein